MEMMQSDTAEWRYTGCGMVSVLLENCKTQIDIDGAARKEKQCMTESE